MKIFFWTTVVVKDLLSPQICELAERPPFLAKYVFGKRNNENLFRTTVVFCYADHKADMVIHTSFLWILAHTVIFKISGVRAFLYFSYSCYKNINNVLCERKKLSYLIRLRKCLAVNRKQLVLAFKYFFSWSRDNSSLWTFMMILTRSYRICSVYSFNPPQDLHGITPLTN